jgi:hypothetical protein
MQRLALCWPTVRKRFASSGVRRIECCETNSKEKQRRLLSRPPLRQCYLRSGYSQKENKRVMRGMITYVISVTITVVNTSVRTSVGSKFSQLPNKVKITVTSGKTASQVTMAIL